MNIREAAYYVSLSEEKSFSNVAKKYRVSQPTVSAAIKRLEDEFGSQLLVRGNPHRTIALTHTGEQLLGHAQEILYHYQLAKTEIKNSEKRRLVVGMPPIIETNYFPKIAQRLSPEDLTSIQTVEEGSISTMNDLKNGTLDISFLGYIDQITDQMIDVHQIDQQSFSILVAINSQLAKQQRVNFADLKNQNFILFKDSFVHDRVFRQLSNTNHVRLKVIFRTNAAQSIVNMVAQGIGIGFLTNAIKIKDPNVVRLRLDDPLQPMFKIGLALRRGMVFSEAQEKIVAILKSTAK